MSQRSPHGAWEEERNFFVTTLSLQIDILKHHPMRREEVIRTLGQLLLRIPRLRLAGQAICSRETSLLNYIWTKKCNELFENVVALRQTLLWDTDGANTVADSMEMMVQLDFRTFDRYQSEDHRKIEEYEAFSPRRRQRSDAPSPECSKKQRLE
ncbi:hypothetical protein N7467_007388 [Penicillium canescens]|nr:hypothetical protein N7467_007388 [Penicillium canescens]